MEIEQLEKRLEWLDEERRKDKNTIASLEEKILHLEGGIEALKKENSSIHSELGQFNSIYGRLDQADDTISQIRVEIGRVSDTFQKARRDSEVEIESKYRTEINQVNKTIQEMRKTLGQMTEIRKNIKQLQDEQKKLADIMVPFDQKILAAQVGFEEFQRTKKLMDEARKVDTKRVTDLQGEVTAYRKRIDEQRAKIEVVHESLKKTESRLTELIQSETERRQSQVAFIEKQSQMQVERDRRWREIESKFNSIDQAASTFETQMRDIEETMRVIKKTKDQLDESTTRIDRRVNEITEMHRLNEDHFRQEWTGFKADDQKRWANYNLIQDEQQKDLGRQIERLDDRLVQLEDLSQQLHDHMDETNEETQKRLRNLLNMAHTWVSSYERAFGKPTDTD